MQPLTADFLFGVPNSISQMSNRKFLACGIILTFCGILSVINAALASGFNATKSWQLERYVNTHWITTIYLFAGISVIMMDRMRKNFSLFATVAFCLVTVPIGIGSFVTDCVNINFIKERETSLQTREEFMRKNWMFVGQHKINAMLIYAAIDLAISLVATVIAIVILWEIKRMSSRYFSSCDEFRSRLLIGNGFLMSFICVLKLALWIREIVWIRNMGIKARFLFLHYTIDEPTWDAVFVLTGVLTILVGMRGTRILMYCSLILTSLSAYPALVYLWIDYRWYSSVEINKLTVNVPKPDKLLDINIILGIVHLVVILIVIVDQIRLIIKSGFALYQMQLNTEPSLRKAIGFTGVLIICAAFAFLLTDIVNLMEQSFFRVFYATEQKMPFFLFVAGALCLVSQRPNLALYFIPSAFTVMLMAMHATLFHIAGYLYLSHQSYFGDQLCSLFFWGEKRCTAKVDRIGTWAHFFEAAMAGSIFLLTLFAATVMGRLMRLHQLHMGHLSVDEQRKKRFYETFVLVLGLVSLVLGLAVVFVSVFYPHNIGQGGHPLIVLHSYIYRTCVALTLIIYPIVQVGFSKHLLFYPMRSMTLIIISLCRFVEIMMQLDYRNLGHDSGKAWTLLCVVEIIDLSLHFATIWACASLIDLSIHRLPQFDFADPNANHYTIEDQGANQESNNDMPPYRDENGSVDVTSQYTSFKPLKTLRTSNSADSDWDDDIDAENIFGDETNGVQK